MYWGRVRAPHPGRGTDYLQRFLTRASCPRGPSARSALTLRAVPGGATGFRGAGAAGADKHPVMHREAPGVHRAEAERVRPQDAACGAEMVETPPAFGRNGSSRSGGTLQVLTARTVGFEELPSREKQNRGVEGRSSGGSAWWSMLFSLPILPQLRHVTSHASGVEFAFLLGVTPH